MSSLGVAGVGTLFRRWSGTEWDVVEEIKSITGPSPTRSTIDLTSLQSTDKYREFGAGFRDSGTVVLELIFRRDTYTTMKDDFEDDDLQNYEIVFPDAESTNLEFEGLVTEIPLTCPPDDAITFSVTIKISGKVEINSGSESNSPG
ncbi:MAG: hypothetical protein A2Y71_06150 [Bacteroidetes bacterium RBG_13_42_15]|nr:MAG: hypothetical protein A2Y71_06150 [Bacteroidetes bacterium RBG_13_42_15]